MQDDNSPPVISNFKHNPNQNSGDFCLLKAAKVILKFIWKNKEVRKSETMEEQVAGEAGADMGVTGEKQHGTHTRRPHK